MSTAAMIKTCRCLGAIVLLLVLTASVRAQDSAQVKALDDPLLDKLIGDWNVERKFPSGRTARNVVHVDWVLQHQFVQLHYRDTATPPQYEALVLIGFDHIGNHYIAHWADRFGGDYSADGFAPRDEESNVMEFKFELHGDQLTNRFAFDPQSGSWTSTIRQTEKGEWTLFCEDKFTPAAGKQVPQAKGGK
jgi:hypothetical protein